MNAGQMNQRIILQRATLTPDGIGGSTRAWADLPANSRVWAAVKARYGREAMVDGRMVAQTPTTFTIRQRDDVSEMDRIIWNGEAYQIRNVLRQGSRKQFMEIDTERGAAQ